MNVVACANLDDGKLVLESIDDNLPVRCSPKFAIAITRFPAAIENEVGLGKVRFLFFGREAKDWRVVGKGDVDSELFGETFRHHHRVRDTFVCCWLEWDLWIEAFTSVLCGLPVFFEEFRDATSYLYL